MRSTTWRVSLSVALSFNQPVETFESVTVGTLNILECIAI